MSTACASVFLILVSWAVMSVSPGLNVSLSTTVMPILGAAALITARPSAPNPPVSVIAPILVMPCFFK